MHPAVEHILQFFAYEHLPPHLRDVSKPFCELAHTIAKGDNCAEGGRITMGGPLPDNPEKAVALRKLLEAKDAAVRAVVAKVVIAFMLFLIPFGEANAQWHYKTYHAKQATGTNTAQATVNIQSISPNDPGWKTELLRVLNAEKKRVAEATKQAEENAAYLQALNALGVPAYSSASTVAQSSAYGGNSIYGYSYSTVADYWNPADRNVLANQAYNTTQRAIDLADKWGQNQRDLYANEIEAQTRAVEAISGRDLATAVLEGAARVAEASKQSRTTVQTTKQVIGDPPPAPQPSTSQNPSLANVSGRCGKCHSGETPKHGLILDGSSPLSIAQMVASVRAVDSGKMPPPDSGVVLTQDEQDQLISDLQAFIGN